MGVKVTNNGYATISAGITSTDTTITLDSGQGARFPTLGSGDFFFGTLVDTSNNIEIVKVTARSSDSMTVVRGQDNTTARAYAIGDRFELRPTAALFESIPYDNTPSTTGSLGLPVGTTAQAPSAATTEGHIRYNSDENVVYYSDGTDWFKIAAQVATLSSVSGEIYAGAASTLTLTGSGFLSGNLVVNFTQSSDSINEDITVTPSSDTSATVTVTSAIYSNVTAGNVVTITVTNSDGMSSGGLSKTAISLPSGGIISSSGGYRYHTFNSSGTFTNTIASLSVEYLIVAGGGGGGGWNGGGGGGAGGYRASSTTASATNYTVTVGGGGAAGTSSNATTDGGTSGSNSSVFSVTSTGGGGGGGAANTANFQAAKSGGSGGGATGNNSLVVYNGGSGTSGQGNAGGTGYHYGGYHISGGGGGGASAAGGNGSQTTTGQGGNGGNGSTWSNSVTYAGGGGGGVHSIGGTGGSGGSGGGGRGATLSGTGALAGTANTGGGGGGSGNSGNLPKAGGSGIVIIRYQL